VPFGWAQVIWPFAAKAATTAATIAAEAAAESTGGEAAEYADSFDLATNPFAFPVTSLPSFQCSC